MTAFDHRPRHAGADIQSGRAGNLEFAVRLPKPATEVVEALVRYDVVGGVPYSRLAPHAGLDDVLLVAATETVTQTDINAFAQALAEVLA